MLGVRPAQRGLLEADHLYLDYVGRGSFYGFLASLRGQLFETKTSPNCIARTMAGIACRQSGGHRAVVANLRQSERPGSQAEGRLQYRRGHGVQSKGVQPPGHMLSHRLSCSYGYKKASLRHLRKRVHGQPERLEVLQAKGIQATARYQPRPGGAGS